MDREGCELSRLMRRIAETPPDFLEEPRLGQQGTVAVSAIAGDLCRWHGIQPESAVLDAFATGTFKSDRKRLRVSLLLAWLLADDWFRSVDLRALPVVALLLEGARELSEYATVEKLIADPDRREELARFSLARLGFRPHGETRAQAEDRLTSLSAAERARVLRASREAEARARAVREALARKAAEESADKYTRE
ncbi:MAG TPA: hypothetical protein VEQ59_06410 [Polyangiaceae bacterium]|nr:hypothetical protein [Polyangiaceae bacterium]